jgi:murein DD-endopeptidase MepM/ murein hydrolase activator NlpD
MRLVLLLLLLLPACAAPPLPAAVPVELTQAMPEVTSRPAPSPSPTLLATPTELNPRRSATDIPVPQTTPTPAFLLCTPLSLHPLSELPQVIGDPYNPPRPGREERHHGVDFAYYHYADRDSMQGEPIQSILPGIVAAAIHDLYPYGNMVMVETSPALLPIELLTLLEFQPDESLYVLYAHMDSSPAVSIGEVVEACQPLGEVGMTGNTELPHLHLETRLGPKGSVFESMRYYDTRATLEELATYELWRTSGVYRHFDPMILLSPSLESFLP